MVKEISCTTIPRQEFEHYPELAIFGARGPEYKLTEAEAAERGYLIEDGDETIAHTKLTYRIQDDFSRIDYPLAAPVYSKLEEHFVRELSKFWCDIDDHYTFGFVLDAKRVLDKLDEILGVHKRDAVSMPAEASPNGTKEAAVSNA